MSCGAQEFRILVPSFNAIQMWPLVRVVVTTSSSLVLKEDPAPRVQHE